jgi:hypothetical protein
MKNLCVLCTTIVQSFPGLRKFYRRFLPFSNRRLGLFSRQDAKNAKFGKHLFLCGLCAFARDIPIFGCGFAALGPCGELLFLEFQAEKLFSVIQHDFLAHLRFHVDLLELFQPALDADGRPIGAEHRLVL